MSALLFALLYLLVAIFCSAALGSDRPPDKTLFDQGALALVWPVVLIAGIVYGLLSLIGWLGSWLYSRVTR